MLFTRSAFAVARRTSLQSRPAVSRTFATCASRHGKWDPKPGEKEGKMVKFDEVKSEEDLLPPGGQPGTIPTDIEQATGLERLEILGKMQGVDIFDMRPLPSDRRGTFKDPIVVSGAGDEQYLGCTGSPADSHHVRWCVKSVITKLLTLTAKISRKRPFERCDECGSVYKYNYVGPPDDPHHPHHSYEEPKNMSDYVRPDYWYR
ncbi:MAG: hypothetical protein Q9160_004130 [Pyrenula sp. 1 TL-2023]